MLLKNRIQKDMIVAMKDKEKNERDLLRFVMAQIKQREVDERRGMEDADVLAVIRREIKQTSEARKIADTIELRWREEFLYRYLPAQLSEAEIYQIVAEFKIGNPDMRTAMKTLMAKYSDVADRKVLSDTIRKIYL